MIIKKLPWKIHGSKMKANPFLFTTVKNGDKIEPRYPWYSLESKDINGEEKYRGVFWYRSDGCNDCGCFTGTDEFVSMEEAKQSCQDHFEMFIKSWIT